MRAQFGEIRESRVAQQKSAEVQSLSAHAALLQQYTAIAERTNFENIPSFNSLPAVILECSLKNQLATALNKLNESFSEESEPLAETGFRCVGSLRFQLRAEIARHAFDLCRVLDESSIFGSHMIPNPRREPLTPKFRREYVMNILKMDPGELPMADPIQSQIAEMLREEEAAADSDLDEQQKTGKSLHRKLNQVRRDEEKSRDMLARAFYKSVLICSEGTANNSMTVEKKNYIMQQELTRYACHLLGGTVSMGE